MIAVTNTSSIFEIRRFWERKRSLCCGTVSPVVPFLNPTDLPPILPTAEKSIPLSSKFANDRSSKSSRKLFFSPMHRLNNQIAMDARQKWVLNKALSSPLLVLPDSQVEKMLLLHLRFSSSSSQLHCWEAQNRRLLRVVGYAGGIQRKVRKESPLQQREIETERYLVPTHPTPTQPLVMNNTIVFRFPISENHRHNTQLSGQLCSAATASRQGRERPERNPSCMLYVARSVVDKCTLQQSCAILN